MFQSILVPLDGSPFSEHALPIARGIARRAGARLLLAHVHTTPAAAADAPAAYDDAADADRRKREQVYLDDLARRLRAGAEVQASAALLEGPVVTALHGYALDSRVDLIVMTTHGRGALSRFWLGSVADTLVRRTTLPLLLDRPSDMECDIERDRSFHRILLPLDGSPLAEQMVERAVALGTLTGAEYTLLQAVDPDAAAVRERQRLAREGVAAPAAREAAHIYLEQVAERLRARGLLARTVVAGGPPAAAILSYARDHAADLIAIETHGRGGVTRLLLGSVADKVLRSAAAPVLLHRPE